MNPSEKIQEIISYVLLIGTILSASLVIIGGAMYLMQFGSNNMHIELLHADVLKASITNILKIGLSFSSVGIIILGLLSLILTQIIRVALLCGFYTIIRDYWFTWMCLFVLMILLYSLSWQT